jgi:hypothetical protein
LNNPQEDNTTKDAANQRNKAPAFQFYPKDFLTDDKVLEMSSELRGMYITLLCVDWLNDGFYAGSVLKLAGFDWMTDSGAIRDDSQDIKDQLLACFVPHLTKEGYVTNPRLQRERKAQEDNRLKHVASGKKGAEKRWESDSDAIVSPSPENSTATVSPMAKNGSSSSSASSSSDLDIPTPRTPEPEKIQKWEGTPYPKEISDTIIQLEDRVYLETWRFPELLAWFRNAQFKDPFKALRFAVIAVNGNYDKRSISSRNSPAWAYSAIIDWGMKNAQEAKKMLNDVKTSEARLERAKSGNFKSNDPPRPKSPVVNPRAEVPDFVHNAIPEVSK